MAGLEGTSAAQVPKENVVDTHAEFTPDYRSLDRTDSERDENSLRSARTPTRSGLPPQATLNVTPGSEGNRAARTLPEAARAVDVTAAVESVKVARDSRAGNEEFRINEARIDLSGAKHEVLLIIRDLDTLGDRAKAEVSEVRDEVAAADRLIDVVGKLLEDGEPVPVGLAVSITMRIELAQESAQDAARRADEELSGVLDKVLRRLGRAGRKLLSMDLQLLPVKEWSLGGEVSALFVKGSISVTFGK